MLHFCPFLSTASLWNNQIDQPTFCPLGVQYLLSETERLVTNQYIRALLQKRIVCRNAEERNRMSRRMLQDASQLKEYFSTLVSRWEGWKDTYSSFSNMLKAQKGSVCASES